MTDPQHLLHHGAGKRFLHLFYTTILGLLVVSTAAAMVFTIRFFSASMRDILAPPLEPEATMIPGIHRDALERIRVRFVPTETANPEAPF